MAARAVVFRTTCPARARCPIACKPVLDRNVTLRRDIVVRAEAEPVPVSEDESGLEEVEVVDEVQEQRALREDKRQAQRSFQGKGGQRGGRNQKDAWENKIIQVRDRPHKHCTCNLTCRRLESETGAASTTLIP